MTLPPEKIGDKGRRYEIWCDTEDGPMCVGWSDTPGAFKEAIAAHPSHHNWREIDRQATRERVEELEQEIERLRQMIDQTADGVLVPDCIDMFCPKCTGELRVEYDVAYCDSCVNPSGYNEPPLPLLFSMCYSTRDAAERGLGCTTEQSRS